MSMSLAGSATRAHSVRFWGLGRGNMYRIGGAAESTGSADSALELDYRGAFLGSGRGTIRSMAYDVEIMGQNACYSPKKTPSSHLARSH